jgi:methylmalonyl-CoA mutase
MLPSEFSLRDDFPPVSYEEWKALALADLEGASFEQKLVTHSYEGIDIQPVYTSRDFPEDNDPEGLPGLPPFVRGATAQGAIRSGWDLRQEHLHPDLQLSNEAILEDLQGGVTSLLLRLDVAARNGHDPDDPEAGELAGRDGLMVYSLTDLDTLLNNVHVQMIGVTLEAGAAFLPAAALLVALWQKRGVELQAVRGAFNADPLAVLVRDGQLPHSIEAMFSQMAELAKWTSQHLPGVTAIRVGSAPYHHAGATAVQDIAFSMATAVEYLRVLTRAGLSIDEAARQLLFSMSVGTHHFLAIAKLRAARRLWSRIVEACGGSRTAAAMRLHSRTSKRVLTHRDPYVNLLRNTTGCFAAGLGGAQAITSEPFDSVINIPDTFSRRIARNTVLILQEEAHLHRVLDPAGGSWYLDWLTEQLADKAWTIFQQVERQGGMLAAILNGWVAEQIESAFAPRAKNLARRKEGITGVSEFPNVAESPVQRPRPDRSVLRQRAVQRLQANRPSSALKLHQTERMADAIAAASNGASIGQLARALGFHSDGITLPPLTPHPFAEPFEELRDASDAWQAKTGKRPQVFLANMGSAAHYTARATYSKNFFEAGGFEVIGQEAFKEADKAAEAFRKSGANIAVICSSDKLYPDIVPQLAAKLKAAGARSVVLAGNPGPNEAAWRAAGVDRFIFIKCDVLGTLREMLREEGVLAS